MEIKNWQHQQDAIEKLKDRDFGALLMEVGCGKSRTAIGILEHQYHAGKIDAVLLVVPSGLRWQWKNQQLPTHASVETPTVVWESSKARTLRAQNERKNKLWESAGLPWFIVNVEAFSTASYMPIFESFVQYHKCAVIVDESTKLKSMKANRTMNLMKVAKLASSRWILTGTPVTNSPIDLYSQFRFLDDQFWGGMSYFGFRNRYAIHKTAENPFGGRYQAPLRPHEIRKIRSQATNGRYPIEQVAFHNGMQVNDVQYIVDHPDLSSPYRNMDELKDCIATASVTVRKEDVLKELPERTYTRIDVDMNTEQKRIYNKLKKDLIAEHMGEVLSVPNKLALLIRLQQVASGFFPFEKSETPIVINGENPKVKAIVDELEDSPDQVVIWARFVSEIRLIDTALKHAFPDRESRMYYGAVSHEDRARIIDEFQHGEVDILIANPATAGHGLNLQRCHRAIYASNDFSLEHRLQSEGRLHRAGQKNAVTYLDIISTGTVDEQIYKALSEKSDIADFFAGRTLAESFGAV